MKSTIWQTISKNEGAGVIQKAGRFSEMDGRKTLFVSDMDGTLLNENGALSEYTRHTLNAMCADGLYFSVATGRTAVSALHILHGTALGAPVVLMNGAVIYDCAQKKYAQILPIEDDAAVLTALKVAGVTGILYQIVRGEQRSFYEKAARGPLLGFIRDRETQYGEKHMQIGSLDRVPPGQTVYISAFDTQERVRCAFDALADQPNVRCFLYENSYYPGLWGLDIHSAAASKAGGIEFLREQYGFGRVVCFGDSGNDLPMFEVSDVRVAVGNAKPELKKAADFLCGANTEDGVVKWIENYVKQTCEKER